MLLGAALGSAVVSSVCTLAATRVLAGKKKQRCKAQEDGEAPHSCEHWLPGVERVGVLGSLITRANHYAITVSDVAKSLEFYVNVLGLQQIKRPNFDRHGAWLTAGNLEIHLIKGPPVVPEGDHLIVGHLSLECPAAQMPEVLERLRAARVPFRKNVSVPEKDEARIVTQYFLRDPDGYYCEICNCEVLTDFCLCKDDERLVTYNESSVDVGVPEVLRLGAVAQAARAKYLARLHEQACDLVLPLERQAAAADARMLANMLRRCAVWGDLMQGETQQSIERALREAGNSAPLATRIIRARKIEAGGHVYIPPAIYDRGEDEYQPRAVARAAVVVRAAGLSEQEVLEASQPQPDELFSTLFDRLDVDGSGALSRGEVLAEVRRLCPLSKPSDVDALFKRYDVDGSGELEHGEFVAMCRELSLAASKAKWQAIFSLCDDDGNGRLTAPELAHKLSDMGLPLADDELDELFLEADADGDGSLSRDEFAAAMTFDWGTLCACSFSGSDDGSSSCASGAEAATPMGAALAGCRPVGAADVGVLPTAPAAAMAGVKL